MEYVLSQCIGLSGLIQHPRVYFPFVLVPPHTQEIALFLHLKEGANLSGCGKFTAVSRYSHRVSPAVYRVLLNLLRESVAGVDNRTEQACYSSKTHRIIRLWPSASAFNLSGMVNMGVVERG